MSHARRKTSAVVVFQLPPLNEFLCHIFFLCSLKKMIIFGRGIDKDQWACRV